MKFTYRECANSQWYWRLRADNGRIIASGEGFESKRDCLHSIELVKKAGKDGALVEPATDTEAEEKRHAELFKPGWSLDL